MMRSKKNSKAEVTPAIKVMPPSREASEDGEDVFDPLDVLPEDSLRADDCSGPSLPVPAGSRLPRLAGDRDSLYLYLHEVSRFSMLTPEEEHEMALRVRDHNDPDAAFRLVSSHLRLVVRIAMDFQRRWMQNVLDLVQEGNVGLVRAVNK
ncbi:MAG: RNA polymerase subunit sigma-70, partial [Desulfovibrio sp.]|nr:RNA polymerase subunit sigma-70 [Desulfovibrio sp.]